MRGAIEMPIHDHARRSVRELVFSRVGKPKLSSARDPSIYVVRFAEPGRGPSMKLDTVMAEVEMGYILL